MIQVALFLRYSDPIRILGVIDGFSCKFWKMDASVFGLFGCGLVWVGEDIFFCFMEFNIPAISVICCPSVPDWCPCPKILSPFIFSSFLPTTSFSHKAASLCLGSFITSFRTPHTTPLPVPLLQSAIWPQSSYITTTQATGSPVWCSMPSGSAAGKYFFLENPARLEDAWWRSPWDRIFRWDETSQLFFLTSNLAILRHVQSDTSNTPTLAEINCIARDLSRTFNRKQKLSVPLHVLSSFVAIPFISESCLQFCNLWLPVSKSPPFRFLQSSSPGHEWRPFFIFLSSFFKWAQKYPPAVWPAGVLTWLFRLFSWSQLNSIFIPVLKP